MRPRLVLPQVALCAAVSLALTGWVAHATPTANPPSPIPPEGDLMYRGADSRPGAAIPHAPQGRTTVATPTYRWSGVADAIFFYLYVNRGPSEADETRVIGTWYSRAQAGCDDYTGDCSVTPGIVLKKGPHTWRVQTWNPQGLGPWSDSMDFTANPTPGAVAPISPRGTTSHRSPSYSWNAAAIARDYYLQVDRDDGEDGATTVIGTWYSAAQAGCAMGSGSCSITPSTALRGGVHTWWVQTRNSHGHGLWSARTDFTAAGGGGP